MPKAPVDENRNPRLREDHIRADGQFAKGETVPDSIAEARMMKCPPEAKLRLRVAAAIPLHDTAR